MLTWLHRFRRPLPDAGDPIEVTGGGSTCAALAVCGVVDIEESVWTPRYGLKGMIDASVAMRLQPLSAGGRHASVAVQV